MMIVKYGHDGVKYVVNEDATRKDLADLAKAKEESGWDIGWLKVGVEFETTRDDVAAGAIFCLRPDDWPIRNGEPE